jgi:hypothetical protein
MKSIPEKIVPLDGELREKLIAKIELAQAEMKGRRGVKAPLEDQGQKTSLPTGEKRPNNALFVRVRRKLQKERLWKRIQTALAKIAFDGIVRDVTRKQGAAAVKAALSAARERQLELFPGFENLPVRVRAGREFIQFGALAVPQFLEYERKYQARAQRNHETADELHRLAVAVAPFAETDPDLDLASAFSRVKEQPAKIAVLPRMG